MTKLYPKNFLALGIVVVTIVALSGVSKAADVATQSIEEQLRVQQQLLDRVEEDDPQNQTDEAAGAGRASLSVRSAPKPPMERDYPPSIFDESTVVVVPGQWKNKERLVLLKRELDADRDGNTEIVRWVDPNSMLVVRQMEDSNYDGIQDIWTDYEWGAATTRTLDTNNDGNPDAWERYSAGRMSSREIDRNDDGVRDAFYRYEGDSLAREEYDANDDGRVDQTILYQNRQRDRAEEDINRDGKMDLWTFFIVNDGVELPSRIERDSKGNGVADTYEMFEPTGGTAVLVRKEEDVNGDGSIDVISIFQKGKLVRREILDLSVSPGA
jgi:hypothetical protein